MTFFAFFRFIPYHFALFSQKKCNFAQYYITAKWKTADVSCHFAIAKGKKNHKLIGKMENLSIGLTLMVVGMVTVFAILLIVINLSKLLICVVNKICPEEEVQKKKAVAPKAVAQIDDTVMEVIKATVTKITAGKGTVASVEKL